MRRFSTRYIIVIGILIIFGSVFLFIQYKQPVKENNVDISKIPFVIGEWQGEESLVDKKTKDILETEAVLMRRYTKDNDSVWLAIVYYKDSRVALHLPESCYSGQGSHIVKRDREEIIIPGLKNFYANKLVLKGDKGNQVILYYFETGDISTSSYQTMRWQMILNKLKSKSNSGALVRFSASIGENQEKTLTELKEFIKKAAPIISKSLF